MTDGAAVPVVSRLSQIDDMAKGAGFPVRRGLCDINNMAERTGFPVGRSLRGQGSEDKKKGNWTGHRTSGMQYG